MKIRLAKDTDTNFIISTWLKSYYDSLKHYSEKAMAKFIPSHEVYFKEHQDKIKAYMKRGTIIVCTAPDDDDQIIGYMAYEGDCLHFCYVKNVFRKMGVAKELKKSAGGLKQFSHFTTYARYVRKGLDFNPYRF